jgi:hypothetical protein
MSLFSDLVALFSNADGVRDDYTGISIEEILNLIQSTDELRFYVDDTPNFGHQATTINIMKRIIDASGYTRSVKIIYKGDKTPTKLAILLPRLIPANINQAILSYGSCKDNITFLNYDSMGTLTPKRFGFTGGADSNATTYPINYATRLNVAYFLRLQPYLWDDVTLRPTIASLVERIDVQPVNLNTQSSIFSGLAYKFLSSQCATVDTNIWQWYIEQKFDTNLAIRTSNASAIYNSYHGNESNINLWPVYGLHQFQRSDEISFNLVISALLCQQEIPKPIVILHFSDPERAINIFDYLTPFAEDLIGKNPELPALAKKISDDFGVGNSIRPKKNLDSFIVQISKLIEPSIKLDTTLLLLSGYNTAKGYVDISEGLDKIFKQLTSNTVVVVSIGSVPVDVYNYFFANAGLPGIFEGQGTSSLLISLGKPFLQIPKEGQNDAKNYPTTLNSIDYSQTAQDLKESVITLRDQTIDQYLKITPAIDPAKYSEAISKSTMVILSSITKDSELNTYSTNLGIYYQKDIHDKLMLGLVAVDALILVSTPELLSKNRNYRFGAEAKILTLAEIFEKLNSSWSAGIINVLSALPNTYLSNYFGAVTSNSFSLAVDQKSIVAEKDGSGNIVKVTISNATTTSFLGITMNIGFEFTADTGPVITKVTATVDQQWTLDGVPWIILEDPGFTMTVNEGGFPVQGGIMGTIQSNGTSVNLLIEYPVAENEWLISASFKDNYPGIQTIFQTAGGINLVQSLPAPLSQLAGFGLKNVQLMFNTATKSFDYMAFEMSTSSSWEISTHPLFSIKPTVTVAIYNVADVAHRKTSFQISGEFVIGAGTISVTGGFPDFEIYGGLTNGVIELSDLLALFGGTLDLNTSVTQFDFDFIPGIKYYQIGASLEADKPLVIASIFSIDNLNFNVLSNNSSNTITLGGQITILPDTQKIIIQLGALYSTGNGWEFYGKQTSGAINIGDILTFYINKTWKPEDQFNFSISGLSFKISTATSYWEFSAQTAQPWAIDFLKLSIQGKALIGYGKKEESSPVGKYGSISAEIKWFGIDLTVFYNFDPDYSAYGIKWGLLEGKVIKESKDGVEHQIATLHFTESTSLGSIIETFVSWATGSKFGLAAPWNILNDIPLNNLSLSYDFTAKSVSFGIGIGPIELGFATIKGINVSYNNNDPKPENNGVMVTLDITSAFGNVPSWNAAKPETTPAPPGQGNKYLDLRMLAMGQHVTLPCFKTANTVEDAIACMETMPDPEPGMIPGVTLDPDSSWLIGMDFGVLRLSDDSKKTDLEVVTDHTKDYFLTLQIIFNDPNLYALRVALEGEPAKVFKGLDFQIMYKKISDTVGVYMAEIALPDAMRQIKMGEFNITLPVFAIQIYTNGDFQVDLGFPWNQNFSRSLSFEAWIITPIGPIPVMGSVGLYFGKLSSATTTRVPQTTTGTFNPVLVFGFGIQFGFGFSFNAGILNAGFSLTAIAILEGLIAKWNPYQLPAVPDNNSQVETSYYFWFRGTVGIIGKLYGSIDFAIIKANLNIDIRIIVMITFESYAPILLSLTASVDVSLSVTINLGIFKIHISFSFSARISQSVTIDAFGGIAPWADASLSTLNIPARKMLSSYSKSRILITEDITPNWSNLIQADIPVSLNGYLGLGLTMAGDNAINLKDQLACYVTMLFIESVPPPQDNNTDCIKRAFLKASDIPEPDVAFEKLCKMVFRWAIASVQSAPMTSDQIDNLTITDEELKQLLDYLTNRNNPIPISSSDIENFMTQQFKFIITADPAKGESNATYFPVPDDMTFSVPAYGTYPQLSYNYGSYNSLSANYVRDLANYFDQLAVILQQQSDCSKKLTAIDTTTSMSSFVFRDYFVLICRQMLQAGIDSLKDFKYFLSPNDSPNDIVTWVNQNGQSAYSIQELFNDNANVLLNASTGNKLTIENSNYLIQSGDTFDSISKLANYTGGFTSIALATLNNAVKNILRAGISVQYPKKTDYVTLPGQSLTDIATAIEVQVSELINNSNIISVANLLLPVATISIPPFNYSVSSNDTLKSIASKFGITPTILANTIANVDIPHFFDASITSIDIVALGQFNVGKLLQEIQATQGLQHLSGMTSRYYLAGLRLKTEGITPKYPGMWVKQDKDKLTLPETAGLYALTGQQFPLPTIAINNFDIKFSTTSGWMIFSGPTPSEATISIVPGQFKALQILSVSTFATQKRLDVGTSFLGNAGTFTSDFATYPFTSEISWNSASDISMPYGGTPSGVPSLKLWQLPDTLLQLPDPSRPVAPRVKMLIGQYNSATGSMVNSDVKYYGHATNLEFNIKKIPPIPNSPSTLTTYEISGADGVNAELLEKIVTGIGNNDSLIGNLMVAYSVNPNGSTPNGIQTDDPKFLTIGIAQVNLSTETRPDQAFADTLRNRLLDTEQGFRLLNTPSEFVKLLWEASITRAGGFYLYYYNSESKAGLPNSIFNDRNEAIIHLVVLYSIPVEPDLPDTVKEYMNSLVTAQSIDTSSSVLFAQANPHPVSIPTDTKQTLALLAYNYYENVSDIASENLMLSLRNGIIINVSEGVYEVGPMGSLPGGDINAIAMHFGTTVDAIKHTNPERLDWTNPLPLFTSIFLPQLNVVVGTSNGGNTLGSISNYYGQNLSSLANFNQNVTGIFADGNLIRISGGPKTRTSTVPAGVVSMEALRPMPAAIPDDPSNVDFGRLFLQNTYSLLCYQLVENEFFISSNIGLPAGPSSTPADQLSNNKIRAPKTLTPGDNWVYKQSIPYSRFSKRNMLSINGLPDPNNSPYKGLGDLLKVDFAWQDYYGNRLITTLSSPSASDQINILNQPPVITGYTDSIIGLSQWPSVSSNWLVGSNAVTHFAELQFNISFDTSPYQGLYAIVAQSRTEIFASFTMPLDMVSSVDVKNYLIQQQASPGSQSLRKLVIASIVPSSDMKSVTIMVDNIDKSPDQQITMSIGGISNSAKTLTFSGMAKFFFSSTPVASIVPVVDIAMRDLQVYQQLWYQLTDKNGIKFSLNTSLLPLNAIVFSPAQAQDMVQNWLGSIYLFIADRANSGVTVPAPEPFCNLTFPIDFTKINTSQIFKLNSSFVIERIGGAIAGDFETTGGIKQVSTVVPIYTSKQVGSSTYSFDKFAVEFEKVMNIPGEAAYFAASGVDRSEKNGSTGGKEIWAVRTELNKTTGIGYEINNEGAPAIFAPRPISNVLESRTQVPIYDFNPKTGIDFKKPSRYLDFAGIDMDSWCRIFLTAIDHVLSPEFTASIQIVDKHKDNASYYIDIIKNKSDLADIAKMWMVPAFEGDMTDPSTVQESFKQQLLVQLSNAYSTNVAVQFNATVQAETPVGISPRLYGNITTYFNCIGILINAIDNTQVDLFFNSELNITIAQTISNYQVSQELAINTVTLDPSNNGKVTLKLNGKAIVNETQVSINPNFTDKFGNIINQPLSQHVLAQVDAGNYTNSITITSTKLDLKPSANALLPFLISSPQVVKDVAGSVVPYIDLDLIYSSSFIEHQIEELFPDNPYQASSWLHFLTSKGNNSLVSVLGKFRVPMFLRNFPSPPSMISQNGVSSVALSENIDFDTLLSWDYLIKFSEPFHFPQDILSFTVHFNVMDNAYNAIFSMEDVFAQLAEFITVFPEVNQAFTDTLATIDATTTDPSKFAAAAIALDSFNGMVGNIISVARKSNLTVPSRKSLRASNNALPYSFTLVEGVITIEGVDALLITIVGEVPDGIDSLIVKLDNCTSYPYTDNCKGSYCFYFRDINNNIVTASEGQQQPNRTIILQRINILARQDAETLVELKRNVELVPGHKSADPFIYKTNEVGFPNNLHPTINNDSQIEISTIGAPIGQNNTTILEQHLTNLFTALLNKNTQPILFVQMTCGYNYSINPEIDNITLPVIMQPLISVEILHADQTQLITDITLYLLIDNWTKAIKVWFRNYQPNVKDAAFSFDLTLFSNLTKNPLPLLRLSTLTLDVKYISDLNK